MKTNVLILSAGRRVELVKLFKSVTLNEKNCVRVVAADISSTAPALYFSDVHYLIPRIGESNYLDAIIDICNKEKIHLIVPTIDTELIILSKNKNFIEKNTEAKVLISSEKCIGTCRDKIITAQFFSKYGFKAPKDLDISNLKEDQISFPLFIKPKNGSSSINAFKVNNLIELNFFKNYIAEPIIQEFISGTEYTIDVLLDFDGNPIYIVPRERLVTRSGEVLKGKIEKNTYIINDVKKLLEKLEAVGAITIQCIVTPNHDIYYLEINPRFGGGAPMSIKAGANSCEALVRILNGEKLSYSEEYQDNIIFSRFDDSIMIPKI